MASDRLSRLEVTAPDGAPSAGSETSSLSAGAEAPASVAQAMVTNPKVFGPGLSRSDLDQLFADDHVHAALVIDDGRLITVIQRTDLEDSLPDANPCSLGTLTGRVVAPGAPLAAVHARMRRERRRRLAVLDGSGQLLGLLCLKKSGTGFCSDADVRSRELERGREDRQAIWL
jgi:CBS domain